MAGCTGVLHVASPFPSAPPEDENELIRPAVDGTLRVLRAAAACATVARVVLTSSIAAVIAGHDRDDATVRTEQDWSDLAASPAYQKSKTLAERAAWDFVSSLPAGQWLELVVVNPGMVIGPVLRASVNTSSEVVYRLLANKVPGSPRLGFATVDVRDLAVAHRLALETPGAAGNRYICAGEHVWMRDIAAMLADEFNPRGYRVPTRAIPDQLVWLLGRFDRTVRLSRYFLGRRELLSSAKAQRELGWTMRPVRESIVDTATSLIGHGLVPSRETVVATVSS
jgi:nucleoside-diphosphate-sugar epimerase